MEYTHTHWYFVWNHRIREILLPGMENNSKRSHATLSLVKEAVGGLEQPAGDWVTL